MMGQNLKELNLSQKMPWGFADGEYPIMKGDAMLGLLSDLAVE